MDWDAFFKAMIAEEHAAHNKYAAAAQQADDDPLKQLLEQLQVRRKRPRRPIGERVWSLAEAEGVIGRRSHNHRRGRPLIRHGLTPHFDRR